MPFHKRERALLDLGIIFVIMGSMFLALNVLIDPYVLTVFDGQWVSITREGKEFKFMYDASSGFIARTGDLSGSDTFRADIGVSTLYSWDYGAHVLSCRIVCVNSLFVVLLLTNGAGEMII